MEIKKYLCECCGKLKETKEEVANDMSFRNHELKVLSYVCDKCYVATIEFVNSLKK